MAGREEKQVRKAEKKNEIQDCIFPQKNFQKTEI